MTFVFDQTWSMVLFACYLGLLCFWLAGMQRYDEQCPKHPGQKTCVHRQQGDKK